MQRNVETQPDIIICVTLVFAMPCLKIEIPGYSEAHL